MRLVLPLLVERGLGSASSEVQQLSMQYLLRMLKSAGPLLVPHLAKVGGPMMMCVCECICVTMCARHCCTTHCYHHYFHY